VKALVYNPQDDLSSKLSLDEVNKPTLKNNNAIIKVSGVGVCGSDLVKINQNLVKPGTILGHEMVGVIESISPEMSSRYGFKQGDRIVSAHHVPCLKCDFCLRGQESLCQEFKSSNFNPGAFCEYLELSEGHLARTVQKIPAHLSDEIASFTEPVACCLKAVERARPEKKPEYKSKNLVIGLGSIGLIMGQVLKYFFPQDELCGVDLNSARLDLGLKLGFDRCVNELINQEYDYIFLCAGADAGLEIASKNARNGATICVFSSILNKNLGFGNNSIYYQELTVLGSYSPNLKNLRDSLELISQGHIKVSDLITHRSDIENLGFCLKQLQVERGIKAYLRIH
jgi:L-iditol 2-dehydrogenase